ncbi:hypothetical protein B7R76_06235 [Mageeibacillus indolicus]|uniref:Gram-positive signal peptide protein, YSIRK family n=1 Tax=Mageeibacillus indolicus TaxID=884684 RepID=A0A2J8B111_9FIRM|nr:hypothetical protein [Mageeibacillus indolicus]PNH18435.1 hypothetical protein B7R76_06235 [Mageeibacillus indolicus]
MNKGLKVLSAVLTMSMVLASGVFAVDAEWDKDQLDLLKDYGFAMPTETKEVKKDVLYKELVDDDFKASLKEYDKALSAVTTDAKTIQALGDARCHAQFDLDSANNEILATRKFMELAGKGFKKYADVLTYKAAKGDKTALEAATAAVNGKTLFKVDADKLDKLVKDNEKLTKNAPNEADKFKEWLNSTADVNFKDLGIKLSGSQTNGEKLADNVKAIKELSEKVTKEAYGKVIGKVSQYSDRSSADGVVSKLTTKAKLAAAKINLINDLAEKYKVTLRACSLADYTAKVPSKAAAKKDAAKKDDVPNTASYFTIYVPTCEFAAPAVKYYGAAQVYEKALRRPLVCKKVGTKTVEVPRFTFDELTAYDVACCCCK